MSRSDSSECPCFLVKLIEGWVMEGPDLKQVIIPDLARPQCVDMCNGDNHHSYVTRLWWGIMHVGCWGPCLLHTELPQIWEQWSPALPCVPATPPWADSLGCDCLTPCTCPSLLLWTLNCSTKIKPLFLTKWWGRYILRKVISCSNVAKLCRLFNCRPGEVLGHLDFASFPETKLLAFLVSVFWKGHRLTEEGTQARGAEMSTSCKEPASEHFLEPHWTWALVFLSGNPTHASQE